MALPARPVCVLRHQHLGAGRAQEALQAPARQPVGGEDAMLERGQRVEVAALGVANADRGVRRMGKGGGHRHQQGRPIDTSFDSSFATPAHRPRGFEPVCRRPRPTEERRQESRNGTRQKCRFAATTQPRRDEIRIVSSRAITSTKAKSLPPKPYRCNQGTCPPPPRKKTSCDRRERPHPPPRRSKRPARISSGRACFCAAARGADDAAARGADGGGKGRMARRPVAWRQDGAGMDGALANGRDRTRTDAAEAPAPVPSIPCSDIRARPCRAGHPCAERNLNWRETHAARDHHHR